MRTRRLRRAEASGPDDAVEQEIAYNYGRFYHGLGLYGAALNFYLDAANIHKPTTPALTRAAALQLVNLYGMEECCHEHRDNVIGDWLIV